MLRCGKVSTTQVQDDGFHEIQLNGKQLVFLFMAATVVSVVIFLCGVLVGRGVKAERTTLTSDAGSAAIQDAPPLPPPAPAQTAAANAEPAAAAPPTIQEDNKFSYPDRLEDAARSDTGPEGAGSGRRRGATRNEAGTETRTEGVRFRTSGCIGVPRRRLRHPGRGASRAG